MRSNHTGVSVFILLELSNCGQYQTPLIILFFSIYVLTLYGNLTISEVIRRNRALHTPMYFFIRHLSFLDMTSSCIIIPKILSNSISQTQTITFTGCMAQLFFFITFLATECFLLTAMAYDRYIAICHPLNYSNHINDMTCLSMVSASWIFGLLYAMAHLVLTSRLDFCYSREVKHYFCDLPPLLNISCTDIVVNIVVIFLGGILIGTGSFIFTLFTYINIILNLLNIKSVKGRLKAFSTCVSHLTVFCIFIATLIAVYFQPPSTYSQTDKRLLSLVYITLTPLLNPFIYSLRNSDVKRALKRMIQTKANKEIPLFLGLRKRCIRIISKS